MFIVNINNDTLQSLQLDIYLIQFYSVRAVPECTTRQRDVLAHLCSPTIDTGSFVPT